jgi:HAMP domain-containing protein
MTHLPFIVASYAVTLLIAGAFSLAAWLRLRRARRRLAAVDPRGRWQ